MYIIEDDFVSFKVEQNYNFYRLHCQKGADPVPDPESGKIIQDTDPSKKLRIQIHNTARQLRSTGSKTCHKQYFSFSTFDFFHGFCFHIHTHSIHKIITLLIFEVFKEL
jgi:hypothetical protein